MALPLGRVSWPPPAPFCATLRAPCLAAWQASCLDLLLASECAQLVLLITTAERDARRPPGVLGPTLRSVRSRRRHPLWRLCHRHFTEPRPSSRSTAPPGRSRRSARMYGDRGRARVPGSRRHVPRDAAGGHHLAQPQRASKRSPAWQDPSLLHAAAEAGRLIARRPQQRWQKRPPAVSRRPSFKGGNINDTHGTSDWIDHGRTELDGVRKSRRT
jgi:hypothetical protein